MIPAGLDGWPGETKENTWFHWLKMIGPGEIENKRPQLNRFTS